MAKGKLGGNVHQVTTVAIYVFLMRLCPSTFIDMVIDTITLNGCQQPNLSIQVLLKNNEKINDKKIENILNIILFLQANNVAQLFASSDGAKILHENRVNRCRESSPPNLISRERYRGKKSTQIGCSKCPEALHYITVA